MAAPAPGRNLGAGQHGGDTGGSSSGKATQIPISSLLRSTPAPTYSAHPPPTHPESASPQDQNPTTQDTGEATTLAATSTSTSEPWHPPFINFTADGMKSTFPSRQTESANPQNQNPATQNAEEASTSAATSTSTSESRCPPFISFTDKMIVAAGMKRLWEFSDVKTYMNATYILRWDAQKHPEGLRIWKEEFMNATWDTYLRSRALLVYHNLFSQEAWKEVYKYVMNEFPELREVQGETDKETRQNLRLWDDEFDKRGKKERTPEEEEQLKAWNEAEMMEWEKLMEETKLKEKKALGEQDPHLDLE